MEAGGRSRDPRERGGGEKKDSEGLLGSGDQVLVGESLVRGTSRGEVGFQPNDLWGRWQRTQDKRVNAKEGLGGHKRKRSIRGVKSSKKCEPTKTRWKRGGYLNQGSSG